MSLRRRTWRRLFDALLAVTGAVVALLARAPCASAEIPQSPAFLYNKKPLADADEKTEGRYVTGLPLFNYDTNTKFGFGIGGYITENGTRSDPFFPYTPYGRRLFLQVFATTGGYQQHLVSF